MLGVSWPELMIVAVVTVLVVGPKELPRVLRSFTMYVRKAQGLAREFTSGMEDLARQADLDDLKTEANKIGNDLSSSTSFAEMDKMLDPENSVAGMFTGTAIGTPTAGASQANLAKNVAALETAKVAGETTAPQPAIAAPSATVTAEAPATPVAEPVQRLAGA